MVRDNLLIGETRKDRFSVGIPYELNQRRLKMASQLPLLAKNCGDIKAVEKAVAALSWRKSDDDSAA